MGKKNLIFFNSHLSLDYKTNLRVNGVESVEGNRRVIYFDNKDAGDLEIIDRSKILGTQIPAPKSTLMVKEKESSVKINEPLLAKEKKSVKATAPKKSKKATKKKSVKSTALNYYLLLSYSEEGFEDDAIIVETSDSADKIELIIERLNSKEISNFSDYSEELFQSCQNAKIIDHNIVLIWKEKGAEPTIYMTKKATDNYLLILFEYNDDSYIEQAKLITFSNKKQLNDSIMKEVNQHWDTEENLLFKTFFDDLSKALNTEIISFAKGYDVFVDEKASAQENSARMIKMSRKAIPKKGKKSVQKKIAKSTLMVKGKECRVGTIHKKVCIGDKIRLTEDALDNYGKKYNKLYTISHIASNTKEHVGYDEGVSPQLLVDCQELTFSLYEWEFAIIEEKQPIRTNDPQCRVGLIHKKVCIGDKIRLTKMGIDNYGKKYNKIYTVALISPNVELGKGLVVDCPELTFTLQEEEFQIVVEIKKVKKTTSKVNAIADKKPAKKTVTKKTASKKANKPLINAELAKKVNGSLFKYGEKDAIQLSHQDQHKEYGPIEASFNLYEKDGKFAVDAEFLIQGKATKAKELTKYYKGVAKVEFEDGIIHIYISRVETDFDEDKELYRRVDDLTDEIIQMIDYY